MRTEFARLSLSLSPESQTAAPGDELRGEVRVEVLAPCTAERLLVEVAPLPLGTSPGPFSALLAVQHEWTTGQQHRFPFRMRTPTAESPPDAPWKLRASLSLREYPPVIRAEVPLSLQAPSTSEERAQTTLRIVLENPHRVFGPDEILSGEVTVQVSAPRRCRAMAVYLRCEEEAGARTAHQQNLLLGPTTLHRDRSYRYPFHLALSQLSWDKEPFVHSAWSLVAEIVHHDGQVQQTQREVLLSPQRGEAFCLAARGLRPARPGAVLHGEIIAHTRTRKTIQRLEVRAVCVAAGANLQHRTAMEPPHNLLPAPAPWRPNEAHHYPFSLHLPAHARLYPKEKGGAFFISWYLLVEVTPEQGESFLQRFHLPLLDAPEESPTGHALPAPYPAPRSFFRRFQSARLWRCLRPRLSLPEQSRVGEPLPLRVSLQPRKTITLRAVRIALEAGEYVHGQHKRTRHRQSRALQRWENVPLEAGQQDEATVDITPPANEPSTLCFAPFEVRWVVVLSLEDDLGRSAEYRYPLRMLPALSETGYRG